MYILGREYFYLFESLDKYNGDYSSLIGEIIIYTREGKEGKIIDFTPKFIKIGIDGRIREFSHVALKYIVLITTIHKRILEFKNAYMEIEDNNKFINKNTYEDWKVKFKYLQEILKSVDKNLISKYVSSEEIIDLEKFQNYYCSYEIVNKNNQKFIKKEKNNYKYLFNNVNGVSLDNEQIEAIINDENKHLVLAGAGCGKTTLICGKLEYLMEKHLAKPEEILVISFSNKTVDDLKSRVNSNIKTKDIEVSTIHKLGKNIIYNVEKEKVSNIDDKEIANLVKAIFEKLLEDNEDFKNEVVDFYENYKYPIYENINIQNKYSEFLSRNNKIVTINGERVRSYEELEIANFLYRNGIIYKYENRYRYDKNYKPDFELKEYGIYIEHYGLDENNNTSNKVKDPQQYIRNIEIKREKHKLNDTVLIETYSHMKKSNTLKTKIKYELEKYGVKFNPISNDIIVERIRKTLNQDSILELITKVLQIVKSDDKILEYIFNDSNFKYKSLFNSNYFIKHSYSISREYTFVKILRKIYEQYELHLKTYNYIDFSDMIGKATEYVKNNNYIPKYKYIIVDEYQDISNSMNEFIKSLCKPESRLLCVGDDWQSIYRFRGSNIEIIRNFEKENNYSKVSYITNTYRFDENLVNISNKFILKNNNNISKTIVSKMKDSTSQCLIIRKITTALDLISKQENKKETSIFLIGRYNDDLNKLKEYKNTFTFNEDNNITYLENENLKIKFITVHSAKGLEADYVILINCENSSLENDLKGFPSEVENDPILDKLLDIGEGLNPYDRALLDEKSEERRLFYVALTRARKQVYLNLPKDEHASKYMHDIKEIKSQLNLR